MKLTDLLQNIGKPIVFYPSLKKITGSTIATIFLTQFIYWTGKQNDKEGWIYKTQEEIEEETGLSRWEQETARKTLKSKKILHERFRGLPRQLHYKIDIDEINNQWNAVCQNTLNNQYDITTPEDDENENSVINQHNVVSPHYCVWQRHII